MSNSLATLTAQYTDSENEDANRSEDSDISQSSQANVAKDTPTKHFSPAKRQTSAREEVKKKRAKKLRRLVSYVDDTFVSDDEHIDSRSSDESGTDDEENSSNSDDSSSNVDHLKGDESRDETVEDVLSKAYQQTVEIEKSNKYAHYKFSLPPEPKGKPALELVEIVNFMFKKMQNANVDMNNVIQRKKEFRNPSIYEKLIQFCKINEFGTNYPPEIYDPLQWGLESYYEELALVQKNEMLKRQKERKDDKIEQATALARKVEEEAKKRKSKWDQPAGRAPVPAPLTTTVTGTKGTVISAFGALPKKAA